MIELQRIRKSYSTRQGSVTVLDGIDMTVKRGEKVGILGRNGAGKSTLIRILSGAEQPDSGKVSRGMSVSWPLAFNGGFQGSLTGLDNFRFICRVYGVNPAPLLPYVEDFSELGRYMREPLKTYSSGMRARLAFATSMAIEFDCYLIDEVTSVGDARFQQKCQHELFEKRGDRTMIMVSHHPDMIQSHCTTFCVLHGGHMTRFENVDQAYDFYTRVG